MIIGKNEFDISKKIDENHNDVNIAEIQDFLEKFTNEFATETINFYEHWEMLPFTYSEKQVNSVVIPAMHKVSKNVWLEQPFKSSDVQRFLDIATVYGDNIFLIELKHSWNSKSEDIAKKSDKEWKTAIEQISDLKRNTVKQFVNHQDYNIYRMALMIMPTEVTNDLNHDILKATSQEYAEDIFIKYQNDWKKAYQANYVATWKLEDHEKYTYEYNKGKQIFPFISFVARIEKIFD